MSLNKPWGDTSYFLLGEYSYFFVLTTHALQDVQALS